MASLFEQYEQASQRTSTASRTYRRPDLCTSGFINLKLEDDVPIFNKQRINFRPTHPTASLAVNNNQLALVMSNKVLLRIDLSKKEPQPEETDLMKVGGDKYNQTKVGNLFMDPKGDHSIITLVSRDGETAVDALHLGRASRKPKSTGKMKNHVVTAVAWGRHNPSETNTGPILIGTNKGLIFETELSSSDDRYASFTSVEQYWKQVFDIGKGSVVVITGLEFFCLNDKDAKHFVLVTAPSRLYQFVGQVGAINDPPVTQAIFALYSEVPDFKKVLHFHIQNGKFEEALDTLRKQNDPELFYEFSPSLIRAIPTETVDAWIGQKRHLIPAMVHYEHHNPDRVEKNEVIRYLEFCVRTLDVQDQAIHNYIVSIYARLQPDKLVPFLLVQGQDGGNQAFDLKYVLRICAERGNHRACVQVYSAMGLYEKAVELALTIARKL